MRKIPIFPGASSPTEIYSAWRAGARMVKVFPARSLGPAYIKDVLAPLDTIELMPTGGVTLRNMDAFLAAGAKAFGMGSELFDTRLIEQEDWQTLGAHLRTFREHLEKSRQTGPPRQG
jgi:2-dehydro-3-deoxyphosphogluconate aldolase/(4S)-4-hydroxy-2-oxoglutarate aldolase